MEIVSAVVDGTEAGRRELDGWIAPDGRFYWCRQGGHILLAEQLRTAGNGPRDPWDMIDGWVKVWHQGEVITLPTVITNAQWSTLADMLIAASDGTYRSHLRASLRDLREMHENLCLDIGADPVRSRSCRT